MRPLLALALALSACQQSTPSVLPEPRAHAHNDYRHSRPLQDALDQGFCSVEADIHLVDGQLLVAHDRDEVDPSRRLEDLYLRPLARRVAASGGRVYRHGPEFWLLIDIKSAAEPTYARLHELLQGYRGILSTVEAGQLQRRAVRVVISGNRPRATLRGEEPRLSSCDGRVADLGDAADPLFMPMISDRWSRHFRWRGEGPMPAPERQRLEEIAARCQARGQRLRFWATPENEAVWRELCRVGVDLINTDQLARLREFLQRTPRVARN